MSSKFERVHIFLAFIGLHVPEDDDMSPLFQRRQNLPDVHRLFVAGMMRPRRIVIASNRDASSLAILGQRRVGALQGHTFR